MDCFAEDLMFWNSADKWINKDGIEFLRSIGIKSGYYVIDFGCGDGHYTIPAVKIVGEKGRVYAVDKDASNISNLRRWAKENGINNLTLINSSGFNLDIPDNSIDFALTYDVLHYLNINERQLLYKELFRILRQGGTYSVYPKHNRDDFPLWHLADLSIQDIISEIEGVGFKFNEKLFVNLLHDYSYNKGFVINFKK